MRDKNSGRSRGFAFVTFIVYPTFREVDDKKAKHGSKIDSEDFVKCHAAVDLNHQMLSPKNPHLILNRAVEIRQSDGGKPQDSFIIKKN